MRAPRRLPLLVAMNKMDKPEANPDNVKQGLVQHEVVPEEWGGDVQFVPVSAKPAKVSTTARRDPAASRVDGTDGGPRRSGHRLSLVESSLDKGRGPVATVLVHKVLEERRLPRLAVSNTVACVRSSTKPAFKSTVRPVDSGAGARPFGRARPRATILCRAG